MAPNPSVKWRRVTRACKCPICGKDHWCLLSADAAICMRVVSDRTHTFKDGSEGYLHRLTDAPAHLPEPTKPQPTINATKIMEDWSRETNDKHLWKYALSLGVTPNSLARLNCAWAAPHRAWAFPMRDGYGNIVGIRLRADSGRKWAVPGSHSGLFIPCGVNKKTMYVCEGPTDTAAALGLGLFAVGRPSCSGGMDPMATLVRRLRVFRAVIIADNDDPGLRGAEMLARHIGVATCTLVLPCKDLRDFVRNGGTNTLLASLLKDAVWHAVERTT